MAITWKCRRKMAGTYTYSDTCPKCNGEAITHEEEDGTQRIECQEEGCYWTEVA